MMVAVADAAAAVVVAVATEVAVGAADMEEVAVDTVAADTEVAAVVGDMEAADTVCLQASQAIRNPLLGLAKRTQALKSRHELSAYD